MKTLHIKTKGIDELNRTNSNMIDEEIKQIKKLIDKQAKDKGLWFIATTTSEAYLQQELRKLHYCIEEMIKRTL